MNALIVEDDDSIARFLREALAEAGYDSQIVADGLSALQAVRASEPNLILLDVMLPGMSGFEVCRKLREAQINVPVLIITAKDRLEDKIEGLDSGADDYIVKPFVVEELLARVRALMRRFSSPPAALKVGDLKLDPASHRAFRGGKTILLSVTEYTLLEYLMRNAGRVVTRPMILEHVWQYDFDGNDNVLDVYISYLRRKIDKGFHPPLIHTVRGVGFRLSVDDTA